MTLIQGIPGISASPAITAFTMDATTDFAAWRFLALDTTPITGMEVWVQTKTGTPGNLECVLTSNTTAKPNVSVGVPVDVGGGSPTLVSIPNGSISNNARLTITFTNPFTPTAGTWYWGVLYPGAGGSGWSASHRYIFRQYITNGLGVSYGDEIAKDSTDTGANFTARRGIPYASFLKSGGFLLTRASCCLDDAINVDVDDTSNPDERGVAWTNDANTNCVVSCLSMMNRGENSTSDFSINVYEDDTQLLSRAFDQSELESDFAATLQGDFIFVPAQTVAASKTGRCTVKLTDATSFLRFTVYEFGSQARRESVNWAKDWWYCHRNDGAGAFTDDKTRIYGVVPHVSFAGTGGGGGTAAGSFIKSGSGRAANY